MPRYSLPSCEGRQLQYTVSSSSHGLAVRAVSRSVRYQACAALAATRNSRGVLHEAGTAAMAWPGLLHHLAQLIDEYIVSVQMIEEIEAVADQN